MYKNTTNSPMILSSRTISRLRQSNNRIQTSIYRADSAIWCILLL